MSEKSWQEFVDRHQPGDVLEGVVVRIAPFGSFVETEGVHGLAFQQSASLKPCRHEA